jgi:acyl-CoA thioester hydrolase
MTEHKQCKYFHVTPIQIRFNDIDKLGHVNNSVYQQYFDLGRVEYFNQVLVEDMDWEVEGLILASITIDYIKPIEMHEKIFTRTKIYHLGNKSIKMCQELYNETTGEVHATSKSTMVGYSNKTKSTLIIQERWRRQIRTFEKDILFEV